MRFNFVVVYKNNDKYVAVTNALTHIESYNLKPLFEQLCNAGMFTGGKTPFHSIL